MFSSACRQLIIVRCTDNFRERNHEDTRTDWNSHSKVVILTTSCRYHWGTGINSFAILQRNTDTHKKYTIRDYISFSFIRFCAFWIIFFVDITSYEQYGRRSRFLTSTTYYHLLFISELSCTFVFLLRIAYCLNVPWPIHHANAECESLNEDIYIYICE